MGKGSWFTTMKLTIEDVRSRFIKHFDGSTGNVYAAPGRINLIGEHTDYNNGYVFPGAVEQGMIAELKANGTAAVVADGKLLTEQQKNKWSKKTRKWK